MAGSLSHSLVPWHEVLTDKQAREELKVYGIVNVDGAIQLSALPPIPMDDPALLGACVPRPTGVPSDWPLNRIVRIERRSAFAGISIAYRVVSSVSGFPAAFKGRKRSDQLGIKDVQEFELGEAFDEGPLESFDIQLELDEDEVGDVILLDKDEDFESMNVKELRTLLKDKGMKVSGKKKDLIQRLKKE